MEGDYEGWKGEGMEEGLGIELQVDMCFLSCGAGHSLARAEMGLSEAWSLQQVLQLLGSMGGTASL